MHKQAQEKLGPVGGLKPHDTILMPTRLRLAAGVTSRARNEHLRISHNNGEGPSSLQIESYGFCTPVTQRQVLIEINFQAPETL